MPQLDLATCLSEDDALAYLAGQVEISVEHHLDGCSECRAFVHALALMGSHDSVDDVETTQVRRGLRHSARAVIGDFIDRYEVIEKLGSGGMGSVFRAHDASLDRSVAIKLLHKESTQKRDVLRSEAKTLASLSHPHIVTVYEVGYHDGASFLAMEFVEGLNLRKWQETHPNTTELVDLLLAAGRGLVAAHNAGVVHRDIKPDNILISNGGVAKITDFGLAAPTSVARENLEPTTVRNAAGTPAYMSPEQFANDNIGPASDQFSFAVTLCEVLSGSRPFKGRTTVELASNVVSGRVDRQITKRLPMRYRKAVKRALSANPKDRFPSMEAFLARLHSCKTMPIRLGLVGIAVGLAIGGGAVWGARKASKAHVSCATASSESIQYHQLRQQVDGSDGGALWARLDRQMDEVKVLRTQSCQKYQNRSISKVDREDQANCLAEVESQNLYLLEAVHNQELTDSQAHELLSNGLMPGTCETPEIARAVLPIPRNHVSEVTHLRRRLWKAVVLNDVPDALEATAAIFPDTEAFLPIKAETLFHLARLSQNADDSRQAEEYFVRAATVTEQCGYDHLRARIYVNLIDIYSLNEPDKVEQANQRAVAILQRFSWNQDLEARRIYSMALHYDAQGQSKKAAAEYAKLDQVKDGLSHYRYAQAYLGKYATLFDEYDMAELEVLVDELLRYMEKHHVREPALLIGAYSLLFDIYSAQLKDNEARALLKKYEVLSRQTYSEKSVDYALVLFEMSQLSPDDEKALELLRQAEAIVDERLPPLDRRTLYIKSQVVYLLDDVDQLTEAIRRCEELVVKQKDSGYQGSMVLDQLVLASLYFRDGQKAKARALAAEVIPSAVSEDRGPVLEYQVLVAFDEGRLKAVTKYAREMILLAGPQGKYLEAEATVVLAVVAYRRKDFDELRRLLDRIEALNNREYNEEPIVLFLEAIRSGDIGKAAELRKKLAESSLSRIVLGEALHRSLD